jgi:hypothetical protein
MNLTQYKGFVAKIGALDGKSKKPPYRAYTKYSFKVEKEDGTEYPEWFSFGFDSPPFKEGDYISFETEEKNGYTSVKAGSGSVIKNPPARNTAKTKGTAPIAGTVSSDTGTGSAGADRQTQIVLQHSQEMAIRLVETLLSNDALPTSSAKTAAGTVKRYDEVMSFVDKLTVKLYNDVVTARLLETVADTVTVTKADGAIPSQETTSGKDNDKFE